MRVCARIKILFWRQSEREREVDEQLSTDAVGHTVMFYNSPASQVVLLPSLTIPRRKLSDGLALKQEWHHISSFQSSSKKMEMQLRVWNASCEVFGLIKLKTVVVTYAEKTSSATHDGEKFGLNHIKQP